jgi:hypothetical protein
LIEGVGRARDPEDAAGHPFEAASFERPFDLSFCDPGQELCSRDETVLDARERGDKVEVHVLMDARRARPSRLSA